MKLKILALFLVLAATSHGQSQMRSAGGPPLIISSEAEHLARGYETAFKSIRRTPVFLTYERAGKLWTIVSVRSVRAEGGVVVVETDNRLTFALNPRDIVLISDSPPEG